MGATAYDPKAQGSPNEAPPQDRPITSDELRDEPTGADRVDDRSELSITGDEPAPDADDKAPADNAIQESLAEQDRDEIEAERERRLDPDNRPPNSEVDNTGRPFDEATGRFEDDEGGEDISDRIDPAKGNDA